MWQLNGPAASYLLASIVFLLAFSLIFSFRDTSRALAEFFDIRAIRRLFRSPLAIVSLLVLFAFFALLWQVAGDFTLALILTGIFLVPGLSLVWLLVTEVLEVLRNRRERRH